MRYKVGDLVEPHIHSSLAIMKYKRIGLVLGWKHHADNTKSVIVVWNDGSQTITHPYCLEKL